MKVLYVTGDDYAAMHVEDEIGIKEATKMTEDAGGKLTIDNDEVYADLKIIQFKDVDPAFIGFIYDNIMDYDMAKHTSFFVIDEENDGIK